MDTEVQSPQLGDSHQRESGDTPVQQKVLIVDTDGKRQDVRQEVVNRLLHITVYMKLSYSLEEECYVVLSVVVVSHN